MLLWSLSTFPAHGCSILRTYDIDIDTTGLHASLLNCVKVLLSFFYPSQYEHPSCKIVDSWTLNKIRRPIMKTMMVHAPFRNLAVFFFYLYQGEICCRTVYMVLPVYFRRLYQSQFIAVPLQRPDSRSPSATVFWQNIKPVLPEAAQRMGTFHNIRPYCKK